LAIKRSLFFSVAVESSGWMACLISFSIA